MTPPLLIRESSRVRRARIVVAPQRPVEVVVPPGTSAAWIDGWSRIRIGDPRSRWGSCSTRGTLSFSWRLVMAPSWVADYVVVHELCHLRQMNHSRRFWQLVDEAYPSRRAAQAWLKRHGPE